MAKPSKPASKSFSPQAEPATGLSGAAPMADGSLQAMHEHLLREKDEPAEGFSLTPIILIFLFAAQVFWSGLYIANHAGGFQWDISNDNIRPGEGSKSAAPQDPMKVGARIFKNQCQQCHGPEGKGQPGAYPPLAGSPWPVSEPALPISILLAGMSGPIHVLDGDYNNAMPNVGQTLKDSELADVLTYVRASFGNNAPPVDESEVADLRAQVGKRGPWTPDEITKIHPVQPQAPVAPAAASGVAPAAGAPAAAPTPIPTAN